MGNEFAQFIEWREYEQLEWFCWGTKTTPPAALRRELNHLYRRERALWDDDHSWNGFGGWTRTTPPRAF
jgi:1,4-alpha-glucan branching enzyme